MTNLLYQAKNLSKTYGTGSGQVDALQGVDLPIEAGEVIALSGDTGSLKGPCLYFELRHHGEPLNPSEWLRTP